MKVRTLPSTPFTNAEDSFIYNDIVPAIKKEVGDWIYTMHKQLLQCYETDVEPYGDIDGMMPMPVDELVVATQSSLKDVKIVFADIPQLSGEPNTQVGAKRPRQVYSNAKNDSGNSDYNGDEDEVETKKIRAETQELATN